MSRWLPCLLCIGSCVVHRAKFVQRANLWDSSFHCTECNDGNYDICPDCARTGIYCRDDSHSWVKQIIENGLRSSDVTISPEWARKPISVESYPSRFRPPQNTDTPKSLFADGHRFIRKSDPREILIYTDGACLRNGQSNPQAGFAFVYRPSDITKPVHLPMQEQ